MLLMETTAVGVATHSAANGTIAVGVATHSAANGNYSCRCGYT